MSFIKRSLIFMLLLLLSIALVACDDDTNRTDDDIEGGGGGLGTDIDPSGTVIAEPGTDFDPTPIVTEEMEATATTMVEPTVEPMEEPTATVEMTATRIVTGTEQVPGTVTTMITGTQAILASDLVGMDITDQDGDEVGEVSELLIDRDGMVHHVIFDIGGFFGIGAESVIVAWDDMEVRLKDDIDVVDEIFADELTIVYTGAAFDVENLPRFDIDILDDGYIIDADVDVDDDFDVTPYVGMLQVSEFQDYDLRNNADEDLGEVEDLIIDLAEGMVTYAVVDFGGFLGIAENSVAVPWERLEINVVDEDDEIFILDIAEADLENAPLFDFDDWAYPVDVDWDADVDTYWETR